MKFWKAILPFAITAVVASCQTSPRHNEAPEMIPYLEVANIIHGLGGPHVLDLKNPRSGKQVVVVGCPHSMDTTGKEFELIDTYFRHLHPTIAFNEGGPVADNVHFSSRNQAILSNGETGQLKFLCDQAGIKMMDGDLAAREEFAGMTKEHPKEDLFLYYTIERFMWPSKYAGTGNQSFESAYSDFVNNYMVKNGFPLEDSEKSLAYFHALYKEKIGQPFDRETFDVSRFDFLSDNGTYCEIGRTSKVIRDKALLKKIEDALHQHDRIFVTFGGAHVIAFEPALKQIIQASE